MASEHVTTVSTDNERGDVTLVGVVHDHPASKYRVRTVVQTKSPDVLGLELPPLAVPLFESHADDDRTPPVFGGEMSTAIQAASTDDVVGIDGPTFDFCRDMATKLVRERASRETVGRTLRGLFSITRTAIVCRVAATLATRLSLRVEVDSPTAHDTDWADSPETQATDERQQVRRANAVLEAFESSPSSEYRSEAREQHMADRLEVLRRRGDVVAVVGIGHFDPIADRLIETDTED